MSEDFKRLVDIAKKIILFGATWMIAFWVMNLVNYSDQGSLNFATSLAVAILVTFVWQRMAKKYL